jgi:hypothetical protein
MSVTFEAKLPQDIPDSLAAYELAPIRVSAKSLSATARSLGFTGVGGEVTTAQDRMFLSEGRLILELNRKSGSIVFFHRDKYGMMPEKPFELADEKAEDIGRSFLKTSAVVPVGEISFRRVTHMQSTVADIKSKQLIAETMDAGVVFTRTIDGIPVEGPGGIAMVNIDHAGDVIGLRSTWRPLARKLDLVKLQPPDFAMEAMQKLGDQLVGEVTVTKAGFGYFEQGPMDAQKVIEPVYAFFYVQRSEEVARKSVLVLPASVKPFARLDAGKRFPVKPQRPRRK